MEHPFYTVIVVSFNAGSKLHTTLQSLLTQTFTDYEVLLKDGGSTDGSLDKVPEDPRIRLVCGKDQGIYDAMNEAVARARGQYFYFLNCGDELHDAQVLSDVHARICCDADAGMDSRNGAIYYGNVVEMRSGQEVAANPDMSHFAMYRYLPCHQACFYSADLFRQRQFDTRYKVRADYEHFLWSVIRGQARTVCMDRVVADYEGGGYSESPEGKKLSADEHTKICRLYFTGRERFLFGLYLMVTLQPVREKLAQNPRTAVWYDRIKNALYRKKMH